MVQDPAGKDESIIEVNPIDSSSTYIDPSAPTHRIPEEPPEFTISEIIKLFRERSFSEILEDEAWAPHIHLLIILCTVFIIAIIIGLITWATA